MPRMEQPLRYGLAIASAGVALAGTHAAWPVLQSSPYTLFTVAVMISAWYGGFGPGLLATISSAVASQFFLLAPRTQRPPLELANLFQLAGFLVTCLVISWLVASLRSTRARLVRILNHISDGFTVVDREWRYVFVNQRAAELARKRPEEMIGKKVFEVFPDLEELPFVQRAREAMERQVPTRIQDYYPTLDLWFETDLYPTPDGLTAFTRDISERKRSRDDLERALVHLQLSNQELERFAKKVNHDLRQPLTAIGAQAEVLHELLAGDAKHLARQIGAGVHKMGALMTSLLDYSRLGARPVAPQPTPLQDLLQRVLQNLRDPLNKAGCTVEHDPLPTVPAEPTLVQEVFKNLIANAIKFRSDAPCKIHVGAHRNGTEWIVSVADNGIGVDPEQFDRIFRFRQLQTPGEEQGTGGSLAICKRIVEQHGGRIWVESAPGKGSTFYFTLPDVGRSADAQPVVV